jgi:hypothetical protein
MISLPPNNDKPEEIAKKLVEEAKKQTEKVVEMKSLQIQNKNMAGKTKTVGSAIFVFNQNGVASVSPLELSAYNSLLKLPGYRPYSSPYVGTSVSASIEKSVSATPTSLNEKTEVSTQEEELKYGKFSSEEVSEETASEAEATSEAAAEPEREVLGAKPKRKTKSIRRSLKSMLS